MNQLDILAVGAHPDDAEIGMGGTLAKYAHQGFKTGIVNLTKAELSSNGTIEGRQLEADAAATVLSAQRFQLDYPDRQLLSHRMECIASLVKLIREYRPKVIFAPNREDRHPDHAHCSEIVKEAVFNAGIRRYLPELVWDAYRPAALYYFQINGIIKPDFVIDISSYMNKKLEALSCFSSQFNMNDDSVNTPLNNEFLKVIEGRERLLGSEMGVTFAEGFVSDRPILLSNLLGD